MNLTRAATTYWKVTIAGVLLVCITGVHSLLTMPRREDPKITIREAIVITLFPGADSDRVEQLVTRKVEEKIETVEELQRITSTSRAGLSIVRVKLRPEVNNPQESWQKIRNRMLELRHALPDTVLGPIVDDEYGDTVAALIAVAADGATPRQLEDYATVLETELRRVDAVGKTEIIGEQQERIEVAPDLDKLATYRVGVDQFAKALQARNIVLPGGEYKTGSADIPLEPSGDFRSVAEIQDVTVDVGPTGLPLRLGDIADVRRTLEDARFVTHYNGRSAVYVSVTVRAGQNIVEAGKEIERAIVSARSRLPSGVELERVADQPRMVEQRIGHFLREFLIAILCVIAVTMVLLPFRVSLVAATSIPVTVLATFALMRVFGIELHQVSISTMILAIGMVVDDAIVITDNYLEHLHQTGSRMRAAVEGTREVAVPVLAATLTIVASFLPLRMISGEVGEFISGIPNVITISLLTSYAVAVLVTPLLCTWFISPAQAASEDNLLARVPYLRRRFPALTHNPLEILRSGYSRLLAAAMSRKKATVGLAAASVVIGFAILPALGIQFFPKAERNQLVIDLWMPEGTRIERTLAVASRIENRLRATPEVVRFAAFIGKSAPRFYYNISPEQDASNYAQFIINTHDEKEAPRVANRLRDEFAGTLAGARVLVKELEQGESMEAPIMVRVSGPDIPQLKAAGAQVQALLEKSPGVWGVSSDYGEDVAQLAVRINNDTAGQIGATNYHTAALLYGALSGAPVSYYREGKRNVPIVVRLDERDRQSLDRIMQLHVSTVTGAKVPLSQIAKLEPEWKTARIQRRYRDRTLTVRAFVTGRLASAVLGDVRPQIARIALPSGYRIEYGGEAEGLSRSFRELGIALAVGAMLILIILVLEFNSFSQPLIVMTSIPLSAFGAVIGLAVSRSPFGFMAFLGMVSLAGVVVRNAIVLIDYANELRRSGAPAEAAATQAGLRRLRPILLTTMAAVVGMTPMLFSGSTLWVPMASAIAAGLLGSTLLTLVVIPVLFVMMARPNGSPVIETVQQEAEVS